ncbi:outer membrane protein assembly factor BamB family protein [Wenjunlia tyrosinilytica]|nr:PQQ-binding-like beta-propeller repeat protein [Wenjunlia tyrosinilytica]
MGVTVGVATDRPAGVRRALRVVLPAVAVVLSLPLASAVHRARPAAYGDRVTVHAPAGKGDLPPRLRTGPAVQAYEPDTGERRWTYARSGRTPVHVLLTSGRAVTLWNDGVVTGTDPRSASVRWHRAVPEVAGWLASHSGHRGAGVLQPLGPGGRMLAVVTPRRVAAYRLHDGDLRWVMPAHRGCSFEPSRSVRLGGYAMIAQPCGDPGASWPVQVVAIGEDGKVSAERGGRPPRPPLPR